MHIHRKIRNNDCQVPSVRMNFLFEVTTIKCQLDSWKWKMLISISKSVTEMHANFGTSISYGNGIRCRWKWHTKQMRCERNHLISNSSHVPRNRARNEYKYNITFLTCTTCPTSEVAAPRPPFCIFILSFFTHSTYFRCSWDRCSDINDRHFVNCIGFSPIWCPMVRGPQ